MRMTKIALFIGRNKIYALSILSMLIVSVFASLYKSKEFAKFEQLEMEMSPIMSIATNNEKLSFIKNHKFSGQNANIKTFMHTVAKKTYAKISLIEKISEKKIDKINVTKFKITGLFWHDMFIFEFLDKIQSFAPGFLNIDNVEIDKITKKIGQKPILKVELICDVFQRL